MEVYTAGGGCFSAFNKFAKLSVSGMTNDVRGNDGPGRGGYAYGGTGRDKQLLEKNKKLWNSGLFLENWAKRRWQR